MHLLGTRKSSAVEQERLLVRHWIASSTLSSTDGIRQDRTTGTNSIASKAAVRGRSCESGSRIFIAPDVVALI